MRAPFAAVAYPVIAGKRLRDVEVVGQLAVPLLDRLMQVDGVAEGAERLHLLRGHIRDSECRSDLELDDRDAGGCQILHGLDDILVFHRLVADVEDGSELIAQNVLGLSGRELGLAGEILHGRGRVEVVGKIVDGLGGELQEARGLGLQSELDLASRAPFEIDQMGDHADHLVGVGLYDVGAGDARLEAERRALDRRANAFRRDLGDDVGDLHRVLGALVGAPVGLVHLLLDPLALEGAVGERVRGVEIHVVGIEECFQLLPLSRIGGQRVRRLG
jgi:hypothetical protein